MQLMDCNQVHKNKHQKKKSKGKKKKKNSGRSCNHVDNSLIYMKYDSLENISFTFPDLERSKTTQSPGSILWLISSEKSWRDIKDLKLSQKHVTMTSMNC